MKALELVKLLLEHPDADVYMIHENGMQVCNVATDYKYPSGEAFFILEGYTNCKSEDALRIAAQEFRDANGSNIKIREICKELAHVGINFITIYEYDQNVDLVMNYLKYLMDIERYDLIYKRFDEDGTMIVVPTIETRLASMLEQYANKINYNLEDCFNVFYRVGITPNYLRLTGHFSEENIQLYIKYTFDRLAEGGVS